MSQQTVLYSLQELGAHFGIEFEPDLSPDIEIIRASDDDPGADEQQRQPFALMAPPSGCDTSSGVERQQPLEPVAQDFIASEPGAPLAMTDVPDQLEEPGTSPQTGAIQALDLDLGALLAELEAASTTLALVARQDHEARTLAMQELEAYDRLLEAQAQAERTRERAAAVRAEAERLVSSAFAPEARSAAEAVLARARTGEDRAAQLAGTRKAEADALVARLDLARLLEERRLDEEAEKARAAEAERQQRLSGALMQAREACDLGRFEEARALLGTVASLYPESADVASLREIITRRELSVKCTAAEEALWDARRKHRQQPQDAVAALEAIEIDGLPVELARQLFGEWARACARLCRERGFETALRYAPDPGRGAVLVRETQAAPYVVLSALGLGPGWQAGTSVGERQVRRARPLR